MKILSGKRQIEIAYDELTERIQGRCPVHIDVGTGSGRLVLKQAGKNPGGFYIGLDPCADSMQDNAVKAAKRGNKAGLDNLLYVVGSIETMPGELTGIAETVSVILPWGSLRDGIVKGDSLVLSNLRRLGKPGAALDMLIGYDGRIESNEMAKRLLPELSPEHFRVLAPVYRNAGIDLRGIEAICNGELKAIESDWAKKLAYGRERVTYRLDGVFV